MEYDFATFTFEFHCFEHAFDGFDVDFDLTSVLRMFFFKPSFKCHVLPLLTSPSYKE